MSHNFALNYASALLKDLGWHNAPLPAASEHPAIAWVRSGLMDITGEASGPAMMCPMPLAGVADGALMALATLANSPGLHALRGATLLGQRARLMGLTRNGDTSPGGSCKLLRAGDGWIALSLARQEDWLSLPALLESDNVISWLDAARVIGQQSVDDILGRARLLGMPAARADRPATATPWFYTSVPFRDAAALGRMPVVLDLSSLWAGPLCGALLLRAGAMVIKAESIARPDGARTGHAGFFNFLNAGKRSVALDLRHDEGINHLRQLMRQADIIIESTRPRALRQLGISAEAILGENPSLTWISITGHGREPGQDDLVAFGDDAAAGAGICQTMRAAHGKMVFCGDAIADPLTGLHAALAAWASWRRGGGRLISLSLSGVAAHCATQAPSEDPAARAAEWTAIARSHAVTRLPLPEIPGMARRMGADNAALLSPAWAA